MTTAGYSGTSLPRKLGLSEESRLLLVAAPGGFDPLAPVTATVHRRAGADPYDVVLLFVRDRAALVRRFEPLTGRIVVNGALWVAWPKKASGVRTDLDENVIRDHGLEVGLVDVKVIAIDSTWSGLKFVRRLRDR